MIALYITPVVVVVVLSGKQVYNFVHLIDDA